jgi:hypothetical protein
MGTIEARHLRQRLPAILPGEQTRSAATRLAFTGIQCAVQFHQRSTPAKIAIGRCGCMPMVARHAGHRLGNYSVNYRKAQYRRLYVGAHTRSISRVGSGLRLLAGLHAHFVLYFPDAAHALCHFHGFVDLRLARDKPAQLDHGFVGHDLDIQAFHVGRLK